MPVYYAAAPHTCAACGVARTTVEAGACAGCGRCWECCNCRGHAPVPQRIRRRDDEWTYHGEPTALFPRYCGLEIECGLSVLKGSPLLRTVEAWDGKIGYDGSVRVENCVVPDREVGCAPARGEALEAQIREVCAALEKQGAKVNKTCGLHCHVDARTSLNEFTPTTQADLTRLARLVDKCEAGLFNLVAPSRRKLHFCRAWGATFARAGVFLADSAEDRERTLDCAVYGSVEAARLGKHSGPKHGARYRSVNFHAFHAIGTIEFRLHHGTVDPDKILHWAAVCAGLVHWAFTHSDEEVAALRGTPSEILDRIITSPAVRAWMQKRREHFAAKRSRVHPGEPPRRRAAAPMAAPLPEVTAGITPEASEV